MKVYIYQIGDIKKPEIRYPPIIFSKLPSHKELINIRDDFLETENISIQNFGETLTRVKLDNFDSCINPKIILGGE